MTFTLQDALDELPEGEEGFFELAKKILRAEKGYPEGEEGFVELAKDIPQAKDNSFLHDASEYGKSILKGSLEGIVELGHALGPLQDYKGKTSEQVKEEFSEGLEKLIPQEEEGFTQKSLRRGLKQAPTFLSFPGSQLGSLPRSILAGFLGEGAKELGAPEWAQTAAELTAHIGPNLTKKLLESGKNQDIIKEARKLGLTDEQITPLIQSDFKQKWLSRLSPKRGKTQKSLKDTQDALGKSYEGLKGNPESNIQLSKDTVTELLNNLSEKAYDIPSSVRDKVSKDMIDLLKSPITPNSLFNLHKDINKALGPYTKELSVFKEPIAKAIEQTSPSLAKEFRTINDLYSRYAKIAGKLKPSIMSDLVSAAESLGLFGSVLIGDFPHAGAILAEKGARKTAREFLLNPRFQQLGEKFLKALNQNKYGAAAKIANDFNKIIKEEDSNIELSEISETELEKLFSK